MNLNIGFARFGSAKMEVFLSAAHCMYLRCECCENYVCP